MLTLRFDGRAVLPSLFAAQRGRQRAGRGRGQSVALDVPRAPAYYFLMRMPVHLLLYNSA